MKSIMAKNKRILVLWMITEVAFAALMIIWSLIMSKAIRAGMASEFDELRRILIIGFFYFLTMLVSFYLQAVLSSDYRGRCICDLRANLFANIMEANANKYSDHNTARFISIFNNDIEDVVRNYYCGIPIIFAQLFLGIAATITLFYYSWQLAVFEILISLATSALPVIIGKKTAEVKKDYMDSLGKYNAKIKDYISGAAMLKSYHIEGIILGNHDKENELLRDKYMRQEKDNAKIFSVITASRYIESALFLVFGAYLIATGRLEVAMMIGAMQIAGYVENPVKQATRIYSNLQRTRLIKKGIEEYLQEINSSPTEIEPLTDPLPLHINDLSFSYDQKQVLSNVNVSFAKGRKYAIIGESGSGKTTLIKILMKMLTEYTGDITVGGQDLRTVDREDYVKAYSLISQEIVLFEDTVRNNITMYGNYSDEEVEEAADKAGLSRFISNMPKGLDSMINENGVNISGGERQRITIARALLRKTSVLIMDEATSSLDQKTAEEIEAPLLADRDLTIISITHKISGSNNKYDEVYRLENGRLTLWRNECESA